MIAIWPAGPPKLMKPSFNQNRAASRKLAGCGSGTGDSDPAISLACVMRIRLWRVGRGCYHSGQYTPVKPIDRRFFDSHNSGTSSKPQAVSCCYP